MRLRRPLPAQPSPQAHAGAEPVAPNARVVVDVVVAAAASAAEMLAAAEARRAAEAPGVRVGTGTALPLHIVLGGSSGTLAFPSVPGQNAARWWSISRGVARCRWIVAIRSPCRDGVRWVNNTCPHAKPGKHRHSNTPHATATTRSTQHTRHKELRSITWQGPAPRSARSRWGSRCVGVVRTPHVAVQGQRRPRIVSTPRRKPGHAP